jgi:cation:H+ antiporter
MTLTLLFIKIVLMGLIRREKRGIANIGFESFFILLLYTGATLFLFST